tara:strand:- start:336 stop:1313 length:978 start_codon:yes stop_codon:yes gene_type:complete
MIIKFYELIKIDKNKFNIFLLYGKNEGLQNQTLKENFIINFKGEVIKYDEQEFIVNYENIASEILTKSLFEDEKLIIVSRVSDKILRYIEELSDKKITDLKIVLKSSQLDKKSKLRSFFEKSKRLVVTPFYEDTDKSLAYEIEKFITKKKIKISREAVNLIISRSGGDRGNLNSELEKILNYSATNNKIEFDTIKKLTNLVENYSVGELADDFLLKNKRGIAKILNENNYSSEDCMLILRTILNKSRRLLGIIEQNKISNNIDSVISKARPPIFWKEKENVKLQAKSWKIEELKKKIYEIGNIEILAKSDANNSLNIVSDFVINV